MSPMISIIDDDESVREAARGLVRSLGFNVNVFASSEDFLQSNRIMDTSCLITDVQMPGLSGVQLQGLLLAEGHRTPIIFITASPEERIRTRDQEVTAELTAASARTMTKHALIHRAQIRVA